MQLLQFLPETEPAGNPGKVRTQRGGNIHIQQRMVLLIGHRRVAVGNEGVVELSVPVVEHAAVVEQEGVVADLLEVPLVLLAQSVQGRIDVFGHQLAGPAGFDLGFVSLPEVDVVQSLVEGDHGHFKWPGPIADGVVVGKEGKGTLGNGLGVKFVGGAFGGGEGFVAFGKAVGVMQDEAAFQVIQQAVLAAAFCLDGLQGLIEFAVGQLRLQVLHLVAVGGATGRQDRRQEQ